ncbi:MAG TPA: DUF1360 domain-containing protein [Polyangiaceae bacterium]|nr:DUF1360 domain-containing protein [Polyangiaceae bacterium]
MIAFRVLVIATVVMGCSHTIARERIFEPLRDRLGGRQTWLGYLVSCPYCVSHWVAFVLVPLTGSYFVETASLWPPLAAVVRWLLSSIFVATVAAFLRVVFYVADESQGLLRRAEKREDLEIRERDSGGP